MTENTTIQITKQQKQELDNLKIVEGETYKSVVWRLIDLYRDNLENATFAMENGEEIPLSEIVGPDGEKIESQF